MLIVDTALSVTVMSTNEELHRCAVLSLAVIVTRMELPVTVPKDADTLTESMYFTIVNEEHGAP